MAVTTSLLLYLHITLAPYKLAVPFCRGITHTLAAQAACPAFILTPRCSHQQFPFLYSNLILAQFEPVLVFPLIPLTFVS